MAQFDDAGSLQKYSLPKLIFQRNQKNRLKVPLKTYLNFPGHLFISNKSSMTVFFF